MTRPSPHELLAETARLAFHFHWPLDTLLDLEHADRRAFLDAADDLAERYAPVAVEALEPGEAVEPVPEPVPMPAAAVESIKDPSVRALFTTYFGGPA